LINPIIVYKDTTGMTNLMIPVIRSHLGIQV